MSSSSTKTNDRWTTVLIKSLEAELCVFIVGWRHAFQSEWPLINNIITLLLKVTHSEF